MYNSLKSWINLKVLMKPFVQYSGSGDKVFGTTRRLSCYMQGSVKIVQNREGKNVTSSMSLFVNGKHHINLDDVFVISDVEYDVIALAPFYREGRKDIWVVYI